eukprot:SAG11_NODE_1086_length_5931_cov_2.593450_3_plen_154_part_00
MRGGCLNGGQILRLMDIYHHVRSHQSPITGTWQHLTPGLVVSNMRSPLSGTVDVVAQQTKIRDTISIYFRSFAISEIDIRLDFRRESDIAKKKFKVGRGQRVDGLALQLPAFDLEEVLGSYRALKAELKDRYKAPIAMQVVSQMLSFVGNLFS